MSQTLWNLIHSLSTDEKRYFKLFAKSIGKSNAKYLQLYDALQEMPVYEDDDLRILLRGKRWLSQLGVYKNYLYKLIIKSLRVQHTDESVEEEILLGLSELKLLYRKQLFEVLQERIQDLKALALRFDKLFYLPRLLAWESSMEIAVFFFRDWQTADYEVWLERHDRILNDLQDYMLHRKRTLELSYVVRKNTQSRSLHELPAFEQGIAHFLDTPPPVNLSAYVAFQQGKAFGRSVYRNDALSFGDWSELADRLGERPELLEDTDTARLYYNALVCALTFAANLPYHDKTAGYLAALERLAPGKLPDWAVAQQKRLALLFPIANGNFEEAVRQLPQLQQWLVALPDDGQPALSNMVIYYLMAVTYFAVGQMSQAMDYLDKVTELPQGLSNLLQNNTRILKLMIYYEQKEWLLIEHVVRSFERSLKKKNEYFELEQLWVYFFQKAINTAPMKQFQELLLQLEQKLWALLHDEDKIAKEPFRYFNFIAWVQSKLQKKTFAEMAVAYADCMKI